MVSRLELGDDAQNGLLLVGRIPSEAVGDLCQKLTQISLKDLTEKNIRNAVSEISSLSGLSDEDRELLSDSVMGLHYARATFDGKAALLPNEVVDSLREQPSANDQDASLNKEFYDCLLTNLKLIFEVDALRVKQKALNLAVSQERLFTSCRILTDIRPVYSDADNVPTNISAAFVFHTFKISFIEDDESKDFYISLDADDLEKLKSTVDRALNKGSVAKQAISKWTELINMENL